MFFWRKKKKAAPAEMRRHYRRSLEKKHALGVKLIREGHEPVTAELIDLSAGGAGLLFPTDRDPGLEPGDPGNLCFTSLNHSGEVLASARVASARDEQDPASRRYGFRFTEQEELFAQLDAFFFKFFNRRRAMRVRPALDKKMRAGLAFAGDQIDVHLNDISPDGFGVSLQPEKAELLEGVTGLRCRFRLPGAPEPITWEAQATHVTKRAQGVLFGAVFLLEESNAAGPERQLLAEYCASRASEMALWDTNTDLA